MTDSELPHEQPTTSESPTTDPPPPATTKPLGRRAAGMGMAMLAMVAGATVCLLATLAVFAFGWTQIAPGGRLSDLQVGEAVPPIALPTLGGETVDLDDLRGSPIALNFWTTWCAPCVAEVPRFNQAMADHADEGLVILGVNVNEPEDDVIEFIEKNDVEFEVVLDGSGGYFKRFRVMTLPTTVWIDRDGVVRAIHEGGMSNAQIDQYVRRMTEPEDG